MLLRHLLNIVFCYSQKFYLGYPPPHVGVENEEIRIIPKLGMFFNGMNSSNPMISRVVHCVIAIGHH